MNKQSNSFYLLANTLRQSRVADTSRWLENHFIRPYSNIVPMMMGYGRGMGKAITTFNTPITSSALKRSFGFQSLTAGIASTIHTAVGQSWQHYKAVAPHLYANGSEDAATLVLSCFKDHKLPIQLPLYPVDRPQNDAGINALGPAIGEILQKRLIERIVLSQGRHIEKTIDDVLTDTIGTGMAWGVGMLSMALWSTLTGAMLDTYQANSGMLDGWMWWARLDMKTCAACVSLHGRVFPLTIMMNDHPHGRCIPLPVIKYPAIFGGDHTLPIDSPPTGESWFAKLAPELQESLLGAELYEAWLAGDVDFADLAIEVDHDVYGTIMRRATVNEAKS